MFPICSGDRRRGSLAMSGLGRVRATQSNSALCHACSASMRSRSSAGWRRAPSAPACSLPTWSNRRQGCAAGRTARAALSAEKGEGAGVFCTHLQPAGVSRSGLCTAGYTPAKVVRREFNGRLTKAAAPYHDRLYFLNFSIGISSHVIPIARREIRNCQRIV